MTYVNLFRSAICAVVCLLGINSASATLIDRGGGLIYDTALNVTWLQDANYAKTSGYDSDGKMNWDAANNWAANLSYLDTVRNITYTDWRLPTINPVNGISFNENYSVNGSTDYGVNISASGSAYPGSIASELAFMYYVNLGLLAEHNPNGSGQPHSGIFGNGTYNGVNDRSFGQNNVGLITNLQAFYYWSGTEYEPNPSLVWVFGTLNGFQNPSEKFPVISGYAWAVRDGDVAAIPEPASYPMLLAGLGLLGFAMRRNLIQP